jgi:hypothetical protein
MIPVRGSASSHLWGIPEPSPTPERSRSQVPLSPQGRSGSPPETARARSVTVDTTIGSNMWQDCVANQDVTYGSKLPKPCCPAYLLLTKGNPHPEMDGLTEIELKTFQDFVDGENQKNAAGQPFQTDLIFQQTKVGDPARPEGVTGLGCYIATLTCNFKHINCSSANICTDSKAVIIANIYR